MTSKLVIIGFTLSALCAHQGSSAPSLLVKDKDGNLFPYLAEVPTHQQHNAIHLLSQEWLESIIGFRQFWRQGRPDEFGVIQDSIFGPTCSSCEFIVNTLKSYLSAGFTEKQVARSFTKLCQAFHIEPDAVCKGIVDVYTPEIHYILNHRNLSTTTVCAVIMQDYNCTTDDPSMEWTVEMDVGPKPPHKKPILRSDGGPKMKVLHLTDLHYDDEYLTNSSSVCPEPLCCRSELRPANNPETAAGYWGSYGPCDIPKRTLINTLENIKNEHGDDLDYIIMTGDLPAHNVWATTREKNLQILRNVNDLLYKYFPNTPVYPSLGNHEPHPVDSFPYQNVPDKRFNPSWLYDAAAEAWSKWLPEDALKMVRRAGFYSVQAKPGLRIISLNSNFCYTLNWWVLYHSNDPEGHLAWLARQLLDSEKSGDKVHIIGHVPPGDSTCWQIWSREFSKILFRFEDTVSAHFYAHTHYEEVRLSYDPEDDTRATNVMYVGGSVTTFDSLNPGYRIYEIDGPRPDSTWMVLDFSTYVFNMTQANLEGEPKWYRLLSAKKDFGLKSLLPQEWHELFHQMARDPSTFDQFYKMYTKDSDRFASVNGCDLACRQMCLCQLVTVDNTDMSQCKAIQSEVVANLLIEPKTHRHSNVLF